MKLVQVGGNWVDVGQCPNCGGADSFPSPGHPYCRCDSQPRADQAIAALLAQGQPMVWVLIRHQSLPAGEYGEQPYEVDQFEGVFATAALAQARVPLDTHDLADKWYWNDLSGPGWTVTGRDGDFYIVRLVPIQGAA